MANVCVTGVAGFLGSHLAERLVSDGHAVSGVDNLIGGDVHNIPKVVNFVQGDLIFDRVCNQMMEFKPEVIYHLACCPHEGLSVFSPVTVTESVFGVTVCLAAACIRAKVKRFVFCSCHDEQTRLVTKEGLKLWRDIDPDDILFTMNTNGMVEEKPAGKVKVYNYDGEMVGIKSRRVDMLVTPNHRVLFLESPNKNPKISFQKAEEFVRRAVATIPLPRGFAGCELSEWSHFDPTDTHWNSSNRINKIKTLDLFYLIGLFIADGVADERRFSEKRKTGLSAQEYVNSHRDSSGTFSAVADTAVLSVPAVRRRIRFCVPKNDKARHRLEETLARSGIKFSSQRNGDDPDGIVQFACGKSFHRHFRQCGHSAKEKAIPRFMLSADSKHLQALFDGIMDGDGNKEHNVLTTISRPLAEQMVELCAKIGRQAHINTFEPSNTVIKGRVVKSSGGFRVSICRTDPYLTKENFSSIPYRGHVWCLEVENGNFLVERNGKTFFSGNSMARYGKGNPPFHEMHKPAPVDPYGIAKVSAEKLLVCLGQTHGMEIVTLVPHNIIGERQRYFDPYRNVAAIMINRALQGKEIIVYGDGRQRRCFTYVGDVMDCFVRAGFQEGLDGHVFNIGPDEDPVTIRHLADLISQMAGSGQYSEDRIRHVDPRPCEVRDAWCSAAKARTILGYHTKTTLREAIGKMIVWIRSQGTRPFEYHLPLEIVTEATPKTWKEKWI